MNYSESLQLYLNGFRELLRGQSVCFKSRKFGLRPLKISLHLLLIFFLLTKTGLVERRGKKGIYSKQVAKMTVGGVAEVKRRERI